MNKNKKRTTKWARTRLSLQVAKRRHGAIKERTQRTTSEEATGRNSAFEKLVKRCRNAPMMAAILKRPSMPNLILGKTIATECFTRRAPCRQWRTFIGLVNIPSRILMSFNEPQDKTASELSGMCVGALRYLDSKCDQHFSTRPVDSSIHRMLPSSVIHKGFDGSAVVC